MNTVFMGTPDFAVPSLRALIEGGHTVSAVFTQPDKPKGRGMKLTPPPVKEYALSHGIDVYQPQSLKRETETVTPLIKSLAPDCIVVVAYGKLLPPEILEIPRFGCVNVHGSLLPKYRGAAPIQWTPAISCFRPPLRSEPPRPRQSFTTGFPLSEPSFL